MRCSKVKSVLAMVLSLSMVLPSTVYASIDNTDETLVEQNETTGENGTTDVSENTGVSESDEVTDPGSETGTTVEVENVEDAGEDVCLTSTASVSEIPSSMEMISKQVTQLAPGVKETQYTVLDKNGDQIVYYAINADIASEDTVEVKANYHDNDNTGVWGKATVIEQANAAKEKRGYNVVASTNASYYNVSTGQPTGAFVMEGVDINGTGTGDNYTFFAIKKDGTAMIGQKGTYSQYASEIVEAVGGWNMLVWEGEIVATNDTTKYPRSTVGIKENGDVVLMVADGNQKPYSAGLTYVEQANIMLSLGCVYAVELDGGGSATYAAKPEGTDEVVVRNSCCDGAVRSVSNTLMVISTAVADGTFDHANLSSAYDYYTPYSEVTVSAIGADAAGGPADIPEDVTWTLSDDSFGTVSDGVFISNGTLGEVTVQMLYGGNVVGEETINIVNPTSIAFDSATKSVPFGKSTTLTIDATYNKNSVYMGIDAIEFSLSDADAATINGAVFTSAAEDSGKTGVTVTAKYKYADIEETSVVFTYGKESTVLFDFEDGDPDNLWTGDFDDVIAAGKNYNNVPDGSNGVDAGIYMDTFISEDVSKTGDKSLGVNIDYTQAATHGNWMYSYLYYLGDTSVWRDVDNGVMGTRLGMWMYIPEEAVGSCARLCYTYEIDGHLATNYLYMTYQYVSKGFSKLTTNKIPEAGWAYVYVDFNDTNTAGCGGDYFTSTQKGAREQNGSAQNTDYYPAFIQFIISSSHPGAEDCTFYIDDITLDYGDVTPDRDAPLITDAKLYTADGLTSTTLDGNNINYNEFTVNAKVAEDVTHAAANATGLDETTAQVYVDGQEVATTVTNGLMSSGVITVPDGTHDVTFEIADKEGNYTKITKQIIVNAGTDYPTITVEGQAMQDGLLKTGAQYNILVNTDQIEKIQSVTTTIHIGSAAEFELDHMSVPYGFTASYTYDEYARKATVTITRTGDSDLTGDATLVTIPTRVWMWDGSTGWDAATQWNTKGCAPQLKLEYKVNAGVVEYVSDYTVAASGYVAGFSNEKQSIQTELNSSIANIKSEGRYWHIHEDYKDTWETVSKAATCTTEGYENRVICTECNSVIDWGTTSSALGHEYAVVDGICKCINGCEKLFTGTFEGKDYVDGVVVSDGWNGDYYYADGVKLTGVQKVMAADESGEFYYDFGDDGQSKGKYTGLLTVDEDIYYSINGTLRSGWYVFDGSYYYFDTTTYIAAKDGYYAIDGYAYEFENHVLVDGQWSKTSSGIRIKWAGKSLYRQWITIKGKQYYFDKSGYAVTGIQRIELGTYSGEYEWYLFDENGVFLEDYTGLYEHTDGERYYFKDGIRYFAGLIEMDGFYYYVNGSGNKVVRDGDYVVSKTNDLLPAGTYSFDEEGKLIIKNGIYFEGDEVCYYKDGKLYRAGLVEYEGDYYYFNSSGKAVTGYYAISLTNGLMPSGGYTFGEDGKMILPKNGIYFEDDAVCYYKDGKLYRAGLVEYEGDYYYFNSSGKAVTGVYGISLTNDLMPSGVYTFGEDGKMILPKNGIYFEDDAVCYYKDDKLYRAGLVEYEGDYYYFNSSGKAVTGYYAISLTNGLMPSGGYTFDEDGKMILPKNGIYFEDDAVCYYKDGKLYRAGLVEYEGDYYYFNSSGKAVTGVYGISLTNDLMPSGVYTFGEDGKMVIPKTGVYFEDDGVYYYKDGNFYGAGLVEYEGDYYYFNTSGKAVTGLYVVTITNDLMEAGAYRFGTDGKMVLN